MLHGLQDSGSRGVLAHGINSLAPASLSLCLCIPIHGKAPLSVVLCLLRKTNGADDKRACNIHVPCSQPGAKEQASCMKGSSVIMCIKLPYDFPPTLDSTVNCVTVRTFVTHVHTL